MSDPYIKWHRSMHTASPPHPDSQPWTENITGTYEKIPCINGTLLFNSNLYIKKEKIQLL